MQIIDLVDLVCDLSQLRQRRLRGGGISDASERGTKAAGAIGSLFAHVETANRQALCGRARLAGPPVPPVWLTGK